MEAMRKSWTDERLDDFRRDVDRRFDEVGTDRRFDRGRQALRQSRQSNCIGSTIGSTTLGKAIVFGAFTLSGSMLAGFVAIDVRVVSASAASW